MTTTARLLFDECFGRPAAIEIGHLLTTFGAQSIEVAHVLDYQSQGILDDVWVPGLAKNKFIVISADHGRKASRGSKLPILCRVNHVTLILLSAAVHQSKTLEKINAFMSVASELIPIAHNAPPGTEFRIQFTASKTSAKWIETYRPDPSGPAVHQQELGF